MLGGIGSNKSDELFGKEISPAILGLSKYKRRATSLVARDILGDRDILKVQARTVLTIIGPSGRVLMTVERV